MADILGVYLAGLLLKTLLYSKEKIQKGPVEKKRKTGEGRREENQKFRKRRQRRERWGQEFEYAGKEKWRDVLERKINGYHSN